MRTLFHVVFHFMKYVQADDAGGREGCKKGIEWTSECVRKNYAIHSFYDKRRYTTCPNGISCGTYVHKCTHTTELLLLLRTKSNFCQSNQGQCNVASFKEFDVESDLSYKSIGFVRTYNRIYMLFLATNLACRACTFLRIFGNRFSKKKNFKQWHILPRSLISTILDETRPNWY